MTVNLFVLSTGFQYYFSTLLIEHLGLADVAYAMYQPREGIERRAAAGHPVVFADASDTATRLLGKKCVTQRLQPLQVLVHAREHMREGQQGFHAGIPVLIHRRPYRIFPAQVRMTS